ncbi:MAG: (Fe-S)-binding protein [Bacillota bacterium]
MNCADKVGKTIDSCRFCWMCRHVCPIGNQTGKEINTARGRALVLSTLLRGRPMTPEIAAAVYECSLCGACVEQCVTGWDPRLFTKAARSEAAVAGMTPERVQKMLDGLDNQGNLFGYSPNEKDPGLMEAIKDLPEKAEVLLFIGCAATYQTPQTAVAAINLLKKAGAHFTVLREEPCCGLAQGDLLGPVEEVRQHLLVVTEAIRQTGAKRLVALCPSCAKAFKRDYPEFNVGLQPEVETITSFLAGLVREGKLRPKSLTDVTATFHDPCRLARDLEETGPARELLAGMGIKLKEMYFNGAQTRCCGGGLLNEYQPELTEKTAAARWSEVGATGAGLLVTACPSCQHVMNAVKPEEMQLLDVVDLLWQACKEG